MALSKKEISILIEVTFSISFALIFMPFFYENQGDNLISINNLIGKITPIINIGWRTNWTKGLVPMKWDISLKVSGLKTEVKLITKCWSRNTIKNIAERAIDIFLAMDVLKNTDIGYRIK